MDITNLSSNINATASISNTVSTSDTTATSTYSSYNSGDSAEVDKEEDAILYQQLKAAGLDLTNHTLDYYKLDKGFISFPPLNAPGNVRRAYRLALANATPQEKEAMRGMSFYMLSYNKQTGAKTNLDNSVNNNIDGYLNLMKNFKGYFTQYQSALGATQFNSFNNFLDSFTTELSKYKSS